MFFRALDVISIENPRQTAGDTIAYVARESPVSEIECVLSTLRNRVATVKNVRSKSPLITVAGIAFKGQADLIAIMFPLEVLV